MWFLAKSGVERSGLQRVRVFTRIISYCKLQYLHYNTLPGTVCSMLPWSHLPLRHPLRQVLGLTKTAVDASLPHVRKSRTFPMSPDCENPRLRITPLLPSASFIHISFTSLPNTPRKYYPRFSELFARNPGRLRRLR